MVKKFMINPPESYHIDPWNPVGEYLTERGTCAQNEVRDAKKNETNPCLALTIEEMYFTKKKRDVPTKNGNLLTYPRKTWGFNQAKWDEVAT